MSAHLQWRWTKARRGCGWPRCGQRTRGCDADRKGRPPGTWLGTLGRPNTCAVRQSDCLGLWLICNPSQGRTTRWLKFEGLLRHATPCCARLRQACAIRPLSPRRHCRVPPFAQLVLNGCSFHSPCTGGDLRNVHRWVIHNGISTDADWPYEAEVTACHHKQIKR